MFIAEARFPIVEGDIINAFIAHLAWADLTVLPHRADGRRVVTVRDDSGPQAISTQVQRKGINVWADSAVDAKNIALDILAVARILPTLVGPIKAASEFVGPYEVEDEPAFTHNGKALTHYYCAFAVTVKASSSS